MEKKSQIEIITENHNLLKYSEKLTVWYSATADIYSIILYLSPQATSRKQGQRDGKSHSLHQIVSSMYDGDAVPVESHNMAT